jgi:probable rRNA maturation factor
VIIFEKAMDGVSGPGLERFVQRAQKQARTAGEVDILIAGDRRLRELNRRFRRKDKPTDVLSFPRSAGQPGGDIAISANHARRSARRFGHSLAAELKILILHGMLHLAGHDHSADQGQMARLEARLRRRLNLPASLIERTPAARTGSAAASPSKRAPSRVKAAPRAARATGSRGSR